jgi:hypothetical protein
VSFVGGHTGFQVFLLVHPDVGADLATKIKGAMPPVENAANFGSLPLPVHDAASFRGPGLGFQASDGRAAGSKMLGDKDALIETAEARKAVIV